MAFRHAAVAVLFVASCRAMTPLFVPYDHELPCWRIPSLLTLPSGKILLFAEGRNSTGDGCIPINSTAKEGPPFLRAIYSRESIDGGKTWGKIKHVVGGVKGAVEGGVMVTPASNPTVVYDRTAGTVVLLFDRDFGLVNPSILTETWYMKSKDLGATWGAPVRMDHAFISGNETYAGVAPGPGRGLQLQHGPLKGRILFAGHHDNATQFDVAAYSDDGGTTWQMSTVLQHGKPATDLIHAFVGYDEPQLVELQDGRVLVTLRDDSGGPRGAAISHDGGTHFDYAEAPPGAKLLGPATEGVMVPIIALADGSLVYSTPLSSTRSNMTVLRSVDNAVSWSVLANVYPGPSTYSALTSLKEGTAIGLAFERDHALCPGQESCAIYWSILAIDD